MVIICGIFILTGIVSTMALCKAASRADRWMEQMDDDFKEESLEGTNNN